MIKKIGKNHQITNLSWSYCMKSRFNMRKGKNEKERIEIVFWPQQSTFVNWMNFRINMILIIWLGCAEYWDVHLCLTQKSPSRYHHLHSTLMSQSALQITEEQLFELSICHCHHSAQSIIIGTPEVKVPLYWLENDARLLRRLSIFL